jgi:hypothetical protein
MAIVTMAIVRSQAVKRSLSGAGGVEHEHTA